MSNDQGKPIPVPPPAPQPRDHVQQNNKTPLRKQ